MVRDDLNLSKVLLGVWVCVGLSACVASGSEPDVGDISSWQERPDRAVLGTRQALMVSSYFPEGWLDVATTSRVAGWARDPDYSGPIAVHFYIQYNSSGPLLFLTSTLANQYRPDVGTHAFDVTFDYPALGTHNIYAFGINVDQNGSVVGTGNAQISGSPKPASNAPSATTIGFYARDVNIEPSCPNNPVKVDLWRWLNGRWEFHNRCYTNTAADPLFPNGVFCAFKYPLPMGTAKSTLLFRSWKMDSTCTRYMDEIDPGNPSSYRDFYPAQDVTADAAFDAANRAVTLDQSTYRVRVDRNGGAVYEWYNKRGTDPNLPAGTYENAIHAHFGAALQIAIHSGPLRSLEPNPCGGQGYWNPTQAGAACTFNTGTVGLDNVSPIPGQEGLTIVCDGVANNTCTSATSTIVHTLHRMMNWDYGSIYTGPFNALDQSYISQTVTAASNYLQWDVTLRNSGITRATASEIPVFYFVNRYRRMYYPNGFGGIVTLDIPLNLSGSDANKFNRDLHYDLQWISVQNTGLGVSGKYATLAWFYTQPFLSDVTAWWASIVEGAYYDNIAFSNAPRFNYRTNVDYKFRYVVFPYRYDETINTQYGTMTVQQTIAAMREAFQCKSSP